MNASASMSYCLDRQWCLTSVKEGGEKVDFPKERVLFNSLFNSGAESAGGSAVFCGGAESAGGAIFAGVLA